MADIKVQMPSEDEDYDVVSNSYPVAPAPAVNDVMPPAPTPIPTPTLRTPEVAMPAPPVESMPFQPVTVAPQANENPLPDEELAPAAVTTTPSTPEPSSTEPPKPFMVVPIVIAVLALTSLGLGYSTYNLSSEKSDLTARNQLLTADLKKANDNPQLLVQKQTDDLLGKVGKLMTLPKDETPTIADVSDATLARQQSAFFKDAQNGDRVLMYVKAGQAILYRPSTDKVILSAPLTFTNPAPQATPAPAARR